MIAEYLNTALEEGNDTEIATAIGNVAKAIGMIKMEIADTVISESST